MVKNALRECWCKKYNRAAKPLLRRASAVVKVGDFKGAQAPLGGGGMPAMRTEGSSAG